jgi:hypothetical protein
METVDNPRLFVDKCLPLWRSPEKADNIPKPIPPDMGRLFGLLQDVDWIKNRLFCG